jgi:hypothetical protein
MEKVEAINILKNVTAQLKLSLQEHQIVAQAIQALEPEVEKPKEE